MEQIPRMFSYLKSETGLYFDEVTVDLELIFVVTIAFYSIQFSHGKFWAYQLSVQISVYSEQSGRPPINSRIWTEIVRESPGMA